MSLTRNARDQATKYATKCSPVVRLGRFLWFAVVSVAMLASSGSGKWNHDDLSKVEEPQEQSHTGRMCESVYESTLELDSGVESCGRWFVLGAPTLGEFRIERGQEWIHLWAGASESFGSLSGGMTQFSMVESMALEDDTNEPFEFVRHLWRINRRKQGDQTSSGSVPVEALSGFVSVRVGPRVDRVAGDLRGAFAWIQHRGGITWGLPLDTLKITEPESRTSFEIDDFRIMIDQGSLVDDHLVLFAIHFSAPFDLESAVRNGRFKFNRQDGQTLDVMLTRSPDDRAWFGTARSSELEQLHLSVSPGLLSKNGQTLEEKSPELPSSVVIEWGA